MSRWPRRAKGLAMVGAVLGLWGCSAETADDVALWLQEQRQASAAPLLPVADLPVFVPERYQNGGAVSPFSAQRLALADVRPGSEAARGSNSAELARERQRRKEPLETVPLEQIVWVGVLSRSQRAGAPMVALVRANGQLHTVSVGNYLGLNWGRITGITETTLTLREIEQDETGNGLPRTVTLTLQGGSP